MKSDDNEAVMAAFIAAIHERGASAPTRFVDARNKSGHDETPKEP